MQAERSASDIERLKRLVVSALALELRPDDIDEDAPLFGDGLGLDSIDALELIFAIEREFGVRITDQNEASDALESIATLSHFLNQHSAASEPTGG